MNPFVQLTKISRPALADAYPRERLFALLDKADTPAIWITAPAGSGKTTLLASYLEKRDLSALWYQIDERDSTATTFFSYLGKALQEFQPASARLPSVPPALSPTDLKPFSINFFEQLYSQLPIPCCIVVDDFHTASGRALSQILACAIKALPNQQRLIITSRTPPPPELAKIKINGKLTQFTWQDLQLTIEETAGIAHMGKEDSPLLQSLHEVTDGWAAGVALLHQHLPTGDMKRFGRTFESSEVFDYFASEVFADLAQPVRQFLLASAFLPKTTGAMAGQLTANPAAPEILAELHKNCYFTEKHATAPPVYRYHPLFRQFLLAQAHLELSAAQFANLQQRAIKILTDSGDIEEAIILARNTGAWEDYINLINQYGFELIAQGGHEKLCAWLTAFPVSHQEQHPSLRYWRGVCTLQKTPEIALNHFLQAFTLAKQTDDLKFQLLSWAGVVDAIQFSWNDFTELDPWLDWLETFLTHKYTFPSAIEETHVAISLTGALIHRRPDHPYLRLWLERSLALAVSSTDPNLRMQAWINAANYHIWTGDRSRSSMAVAELQKIADSSIVSPLLKLSWKWLEATMFNWADADQQAALACVAEGLALAATTDVHAHDHMFFAQGIYASLGTGDLNGANHFLQKMAATLAYCKRHTYCHYHYLAMWYELLSDNISAAFAHGENALKYAEETGMILSTILCRLAYAQLLQLTGDPDQAEELTEQAGEMARAIGSRNLEHRYLLCAAQFALDKGEDVQGLGILRQAMALGKKQGYVNLFWWWHPVIMSRLCGKALEAGIEADYTRDLIRRRKLLPCTRSSQVEQWPWQVKLYTFGRFGIVIDGSRVQFSGKVQQKPLDMLKALVALGGRNITSDQVIEAIWPEAEGDVGQQAFATTLHRLRKMLMTERAIVLSEGKIALNPHYCWVDVWAFERLAGQICQDGDKALAADQLVDQAEKALNLYSGHFLAGDADRPWSASMRERLRSKLLRIVLKVGNHLEETGDMSKVVVFYLKGLDCDEMVEEFYQRLMRCHLQRGNRGEALATFDRCRAIMSRLDGQPSPATVALYSQALAND